MPPLLYPPPLQPSRPRPIDQRTPVADALRRLQAGETLIVTDQYRTGTDLLARLRAALEVTDEGASYAARQAGRQHFRACAERLLAPVEQQRVALEGAPHIGFLREFYADTPRFALSFFALEDLREAWIRYDEGVYLAVLGRRLRPLYGTYMPTRTIHLELFTTWLSKYQGARGHAVDVGTGCGVLAFLLARAGFASVLATDINPNAVESVRRDVGRFSDPPPPVEPRVGDLLTDDPRLADLIVFNPPWTRGTPEGPLDQALTFEAGFFERFFAQAATRLRPEGRVVLLFSNVIELVQPGEGHPIKAELKRGRFVQAQQLHCRVKPPPDRDGRVRRTRERIEVWELARA